jgi:mono/diheme cytochrome c family protein
MNKTLLGAGIGFCLPLLAAFTFVNLGGMPVATKGDPLPLEHYIARTAIHRAMGREVDRVCPLPADEANLLRGAKIYRVQCEICHGSPDSLPSAIANGMFPQPPPLVRMDEKGVTNDSPGESYWKVKNGIRLTGMPGYVDSLSDTQLWQVSLLLNQAHNLPLSVKEALRDGGK